LNGSNPTHYLLLLSFHLSQLFFLLEHTFHVNLYLFRQQISQLLRFNAMSLSKVTCKEEWIVTLSDDDIRLFSIGIADIHSDSEDFSSLITILVLACRVIVAL
jgi:hypothetical protein